ncbi:MAG: hypothetical protein KDA91_04645, partial [Planctomycetaceae bacterium]|nr:hypothetical protein [Planctomycetaceae bacterium]
ACDHGQPVPIVAVARMARPLPVSLNVVTKTVVTDLTNERALFRLHFQRASEATFERDILQANNRARFIARERELTVSSYRPLAACLTALFVRRGEGYRTACECLRVLRQPA